MLSRSGQYGNVVDTITDPQINGSWDMTVWDNTNEEENCGEEGHYRRHYNSDAARVVTNVLNRTVAGGGKIVNEGTVIGVALSVRRESASSVKSVPDSPSVPTRQFL
jgi:hypothetical protein